MKIIVTAICKSDMPCPQGENCTDMSCKCGNGPSCYGNDELNVCNPHAGQCVKGKKSLRASRKISL